MYGIERFKHPSDSVVHETGSALGWVSIGIGLTELLATKQVQQLMGVQDKSTEGVLRVLGVRELMHGVDLLSHKDPTAGTWARVAGDLLDGACLAAAATKTKRPGGFAAIVAMVMPVVLADMVLAPLFTQHKEHRAKRWRWF